MLKRGATIGSVAGGLVAATDLQTTYQGAGLKVEISAGEAVVPNNLSASGSGYYLRLSANSTVTLPAANSSNNRVEAVAAYIKDESYSGSGNEGLVEVLPGNAKAGATLSNLEGAPGQSGGPALPKNVLILGYILVPAAATTISNADIKNVAARVTLGIPPFTFTQPGGSATLNSGEFAELPTGSTATLPAATAGQLIGVFAGVTASGVVKITSPSPIYGDFTDAATTINLSFLQHVLLLGGPGYWLIIAGEPKREQVYGTPTERTPGTEYEPSASRPTYVTLVVETNEEKAQAYVAPTVGGVLLGQQTSGPGLGRGVCTTQFICPAGVKWAANAGALTGTAKLRSIYLLL